MNIYIGLLRYMLPVFALLIIVRCGISLIRNRPTVHKLATLEDKTNDKITDINYWETSVGRSKSCDIQCEFATVSRFHGVISKRRKNWIVTDTFSKTGITVNDKKVHGSAPIYDKDVITFGNIPMVFRCDEAMSEETKTQLRRTKTAGGEVFVNVSTKEQYAFPKKDFIVGRGDNAAVSITDQSVSKRHARVYRTTKGWAIQDLDSSNGTLLNGRPINEPQLIFDEDRITFGSVTVIFYER